VKTHAVVFPQADRFEVRELALAAPGPRDIVVRTLVSAISPGTERWILRGKHIGTRFPCVPGYHRIGVIEECGKEITHLQAGDIVYGSGGRWQGEVISMWGAHVGYSVGDAYGYHFVAAAGARPNRLELEALAFTILAGVSNRGVNFCGVRAGQKMLIIGAGFVGICAAQLAGLRGAQAVMIDKNTERLAYLKQALPTVACLCSDDPGLTQQLKGMAPAGFDIVQDTVGHAATTDAMVQLMRAQGTLLLQAQYFDKSMHVVDLDQIKIRELTVKTTCGIREEDWFETMENIRTRRVNIASLIAHRFTADDMLKGYELLHTGKPHNLGMVINWGE